MKALLRIGDKLISRDKISSILDRILELRASGQSQQEVAKQLGVERTFISRLEGIGEIRQGERQAVIGFPVLNKAELATVLKELGVDFTFLMTDKERWDFIRRQNAYALVDSLMELMMHLRTFDQVVIIGSDLRIKIAQTILDKEVIPICLGLSPIKEDKWVDPEVVRQILQAGRPRMVRDSTRKE